jgi:hypothetical protein
MVKIHHWDFKGFTRKCLSILWHVDPLQGNGRLAITWEHQQTRTQQLNSNKGKVFSVWTVPRYYKQDKLVESVSGAELGV